MKECKKHGFLSEENIRRYIRKRRGRIENILACKICHRETASKARNIDRTKANTWARQDRKNHPEKYRKYEKNYIEKHGIEKVRKYEVARRRGLTIEQYDEMSLAQNHVCFICKKPETRKSSQSEETTILCIDHCHISGKVRKLLCHECNTGLGKFKDNIKLLESAIEYLKLFAD